MRKELQEKAQQIMARFRHVSVFFFWGAIITPVVAVESITGRWALDPSACSGLSFSDAQTPLVVTDYSVRWRGGACRIARMYKTGDTVHIQADCW